MAAFLAGGGRSGTDVANGLSKFLRAMWPFWIGAIQGVPHVGRNGTDDVLPALGMNATSGAVYARSVDGVLACRSGPVFDPAAGSGSCADVEALSKCVAAAVGVEYQGGPLALSVNHKDSHRFNMPPVVPAGDPDEQLEELRRFLRNRLGSLMAITVDRLPQSLLATLVHQSVTIASADAATERAHPGRPELKADSAIGTLLDGPIAAAVAGAQRAPSRMEMLSAVVADPGGGDVPVAQLVSSDVVRARALDSGKRHEVLWGIARSRFAEVGPEWTRELVELDTALEHLATLSADQLELLLREHLDLSSHRLDAWVTSLATKRLTGMRVIRPAGLHIGAYGWVENLHPDAGAPPGAGYVHAPSLQHAATAALLKAGHVAHRAGTGETPFAIDLSGERVRGAVNALEAMSEGQTLGAVLGYRLERRLHDALNAGEGDGDGDVLAQYVEPLRRLAPLAPPSVLEPADDPDETIPANNVVDGVRLLERRQRDRGWAAVIDDLRPATARHRERLTAALEALAADADAAADVLLAESIHQFCLGNVDRSSAAMSVLSGQAAPPATLEVLEAARSGTSVTHRLVIAANGDRVPAGWTKTPRAAAEPRLNAWAGAILGKPSRIRIRVEAVGAAPPREFPLTELRLAPLDVIHLCDAGSPGETSLAALAKRHVAANPSEAAAIALDPERAPEWTLDTIGLHELTELARTLRRLLTLARPADSSTFASTAEAPAAHGIDLKELRARARAAVKAFASEIARADAGVRALDRTARPTQASAARKALIPLWLRGHGLNPALLTEPEALLDHARRLLETLEAQLAKARRAMKDAEEGAEQQVPGAYLRAFAAVFGEDFRVAPVLTADAARRKGFAKVDADREAVSTWLGGMAPVRQAAGVFADLELYTSTLDVGVTFVAGQQPADRTRPSPWVAVAGADARSAGSISLVACAPDAIDWGRQLAALIVDEWSELVPAARQTTGVAFHANAPGARPPQAILVGVHPAPGQPWDRKTRESTLLTTLELSKARAVDLECVGWVGRFLPALYLPTAQLDQVPHLPIRDMVRTFASAGLRETLKP
jgi:hypothetical protein